MNTYHKIHSIYKRDKQGKFLAEEYSRDEFRYLRNNEWEFTEKVDGINIRIMFDGEKISYGGKTDKAQMQVDLMEKLRELFDDQLDLFKTIFIPSEGQKTSICFYGEGYGAGIQKGGKYRQDKSFVLFDIKIGTIWLKRSDVESLASKFGIDCVPIIGYGTLDEGIEKIRDGFSSKWGDFVAEGIIARPCVEMKDRRGDRIITKIKYKDFN